MFYKLKGLPEENEVVLCKVTKIFPNSVFVELMEYDKQGMVHISEVSPGRIRNLRDYVDIGRQIICKVLRLDREKGHIDLSLRRVNSMEKREKANEIKQELKAESLVKNLAKKLKKEEQKLYREIAEKILREYLYLHLCFKDVVAGEVDLVKLGLDNKIADELKEAILEKFKPKKVTIKGKIKLQTYDPAGVEKIKRVLLKVKLISDTLKLFYLGGGRYKVFVEDSDYKGAEKKVQKIEELLQGFNDKLSTSSFVRED